MKPKYWILAAVAFAGLAAGQPAGKDAEMKALAGRWKSATKENHDVTLTVKDGKVSAELRYFGTRYVYSTALADFVSQGGFTSKGVVQVAYKLNADTVTLNATKTAFGGEWVLTSYLTWQCDGKEATYLGKPLAHWAERLAKADAAERLGIFEAVRELGDDGRPLIPALAGVLRTGDKTTRLAALERLGAFGTAAKSAAPDILALIDDRDSLIRTFAVRVTGQVGADAQDAIPALLKASGDSMPQVRREAAMALSRYPAEAARIVPTLTKLLSDPYGHPQHAAVSALLVFGPEAKPAAADVAKVLASAVNRNTRTAAITALRKMRADSGVAVPALSGALKDRSVEVSILAADALRDYGPDAKGASAALSVAIKDGRDWRAEVRKHAEAALKAIDPDAAAKALAQVKVPWQRDPAIDEQMKSLQGVWKSAPEDKRVFALEVRGDEVLLRPGPAGPPRPNGDAKLKLEDFVIDGGLVYRSGASAAEISYRLEGGKMIVSVEHPVFAGVWALSR